MAGRGIVEGQVLDQGIRSEWREILVAKLFEVGDPSKQIQRGDCAWG